MLNMEEIIALFYTHVIGILVSCVLHRILKKSSNLPKVQIWHGIVIY